MIEKLEKKVDDGLALTQEEALWLAEKAPWMNYMKRLIGLR